MLAGTLSYSLVATWFLAALGVPFAIRFALAFGRGDSPVPNETSP